MFFWHAALHQEWVWISFVFFRVLPWLAALKKGAAGQKWLVLPWAAALRLLAAWSGHSLLAVATVSIWKQDILSELGQTHTWRPKQGFIEMIKQNRTGISHSRMAMVNGSEWLKAREVSPTKAQRTVDEDTGLVWGNQELWGTGTGKAQTEWWTKLKCSVRLMGTTSHWVWGQVSI